MKHAQIPRIPQHVRFFCEGEIYKYLINKNVAHEAKKDIEALLEEGGNRGFDKILVTGGQSVPEQQRILEQIDSINRGREAVVAEKSCIRVEDMLVMLTDKERLLLEKYYWRRIPPEVIESDTGIGVKTQQRMKRKIVYFLALRWGMM